MFPSGVTTIAEGSKTGALEPRASDTGVSDTQKYRHTFEKAAIGMAHVGLDGRWLEVNQTLVDLLGYSREELLGMRFQDITYKGDLSEDLDNVSKVLSGDIASYAMEKRYVHKNGRLVWIRLTVSLVRAADGEPDFFVSVIEDISTSKLAADHSEVLGRILEVSLNEVYMFDAETYRFTSVNHGARQNLGYTMDELKAMTPLDLKDEYTFASFTNLVAPLKSGEKEKIVFHTFHKRKDGSSYPVEVHLQYVDRETPPLFVALILDVSEQRELTRSLSETVKKLRKASKAKSEFLANMSHELRTPLNAIIGFSEVISHQFLGKIDQPKYVEYGKDIEDSGKYLLELINDILDLSKIEAGRYTLNCDFVDVDEIVATSMKLLIQRAADKRVSLQNIRGSQKIKPWADQRALKQILINIMGNALKFTPAGGQVTVTTSSCESFATISVRDSGVGIKADHLDKLMQPFVSFEHEVEIAEESTGLGLSITKSLVSMHGGRINIYSTEGEGTEVVIDLPLSGPTGADK